MNNPIVARLPIIICFFLVYGCAIGPDYVRNPEVNVTKNWISKKSNRVFSDSGDPLAYWWKQFADPLLEKLIERAIENNHDLKMVHTSLIKARAGRKRAQSSVLPQLNSVAGYQYRSFSRETASPEAGLADAGLIERKSDHYELGFDASLEIDIFGANRRRKESAMARLQAAEEGFYEVETMIVAEIGRAYMKIRGAQFERQTLQRSVDLQQEILTITRQNKVSGLATAQDVARLQVLLESTQAQLPVLAARIDVNIYILDLLTGDLPGTWRHELRTYKPIKTLPTRVKTGLPPDLLRRRPDIRRSEREFAAATADVGVALAELYPKFFLSGLSALQSDNIGSLFSSSAWAFSLGPMVQLPIFQGGKLRANIEDKKADVIRAELKYKQSILTALTDVESKLTEYGSLQHSLSSFTRAIQVARSATERARKLQRNGLSSLLDVLNAERELCNIENHFAKQHMAASVALITLYESLGGGWSKTRMTEEQL